MLLCGAHPWTVRNVQVLHIEHVHVLMLGRVSMSYKLMESPLVMCPSRCRVRLPGALCFGQGQHAYSGSHAHACVNL